MWKCRSKAYFGKIGACRRFVLDRVIFDRWMTTFGKGGCVTYRPLDAGLRI